MTLETTVEKIKEDVQNLVAPKPANVPAQTKPHYWLYKQGKDVWNRWAREAFFDENGKDDGRIDGYIEDAKKNQNQDIIKLLEEFKLLKPLSDDEKAEIEGKMNENYSDWLTSQGLQINNIELPEVTYIIGFSATNWQDWVDFRNFIFTSYVDFSSAVFENGVSFEVAIFSASTSFHLAIFSNRAGFSSATFSGMTSFNLAIFSSVADFDSANFSSYTFFDSASFSSYANFTSASFKYIYLKKTFFAYDVSFEGTKFETVPKVSGMKIEGVLDFSDAEWPDEKAKESKPNSDALNYSQLKRRMQELHLHADEIFFFRKELLCKAEASKRKSDKLREDKKKASEIALEFDKSNSGNDGSIKNKKYYKFLDENWRTAQLIYLYDAVCKCGDSVARPVSGLIGLFFMMALIYPFIVNKMNIKEGLYLSGYNTFPFLNPSRSIHDSVIKNLYNIEDIQDKNILEFSDIVYSLLSGFQTFVSMALIFLIGLCLRNYLRIK